MTMTVRSRPHRRRSRPHLGLRTRRAAQRPPEPPAARTRSEPVPPLPFAREQAAGGPEDVACYRCSCGCVFEASVSTSVGCPHCGCTQAW